MKHWHSFPWFLSVLFLVVMFGCGGSSGGGDDDIDDDQGGGSGTIDGTTVFWQGYSLQEGDWGNLNSVQQTTDNGFIGTGWIRLDGSNFEDPMDLYLVKADSSGELVWQKRFAASTPNTSQFGNCVLQTSEGGYILGGVRRQGTLINDFFLLRTDANGNELAGWPKTYARANNDGIYDLCETSGGFVFVGGLPSGQYYMAKVNSTG
ncbi:MAG: hypothetical protein RRA35_04885, partial [Desulfomonilia bacterium]|nr:hypothetical protein [Desulfomonilia bacterium]